MVTDSLKLLITRARSMLRTLEAEGAGGTNNRVSTTLANSYNKLLTDVAAAVPDLNDSLPDLIKSTTDFASMGLSDAEHIDLKVFLNQVIDLLDAVREQ